MNLSGFLYVKGSKSAFDGLAKIVRTERTILKIMWSLAVCLVTGACSFVLIKSVLNFLSHEIVTTISVRTEIPTKMPMIIVCNANSLATETSIKWASHIYAAYNITKSNNYLHFEINQVEHARLLNNKGNILLPKTMAILPAFGREHSDEERKSLGMSMRDMLISCTFNSIECSARENFVWSYDPNYGNCYRFNASSGSDRISQSGKFHGLNMELFVGEATSVEQLAPKNGAYIFILNETVRSNPFSDGVHASAGKETSIYIDKNRIRKMERPYGECTPDLTAAHSHPTYLYRATFQIYGRYRQKDCFNTCFQEALLAKRGCYFVAYAYLSNSSAKACLLGLDLFRSLAYFTEFYIEDIAQKCSDCPLECESEFYSLTTSSLDYPTRVYAEMLASQTPILNRFKNKRPTYGQLKRSIVSVNINYNRLGYTQIRESQTMTKIDLAKNVAGAMGLFLGFSFLSFFELVELAVELVCICIETKVT